MRFKIRFSRKKTALIFVALIIFFQTLFNKPKQTISPTIINYSRLVKVTRVIDGDTIEIEGERKVRYIGINAPEIYRDTTGKKTGEQCFAEESTAENKRLVEGKTVRLEKDISETDKYGRLLRYVYLDNLMINDYLVEKGFVKVMPIDPDIKYAETFFQEQQQAKENKLGLWGKCPSPSNTKPTMLQ